MLRRTDFLADSKSTSSHWESRVEAFESGLFVEVVEKLVRSE